MMSHANSKMTQRGRLAMIKRLERGESARAVAADLGLAVSNVYRWWNRFREEGEAGSISLFDIMYARNQYAAWQDSSTGVPYYDPQNLNSNTWIGALLLSEGVSESTLDGWVSTLRSTSGRQIPAYQNGLEMIHCFQPYGRIAFAQPSIPTPSYGGCADLSH